MMYAHANCRHVPNWAGNLTSVLGSRHPRGGEGEPPPGSLVTPGGDLVLTPEGEQIVLPEEAP